ncbi:MAG: N-glycosylase/DNA lyase [Thermoplasmata archaeon]|nr:N-glycosylase/DNA lyase [Thermoplasmata archaeon]
MLNDITEIYRKIKPVIERRMEEFREIWEKGSEEDIFEELAFCLLTPQSKARICWMAVERMKKNEVLLRGSYEEILENLQGVRFKYTKAQNIILAREFFMQEGKLSIRDKLKEFSNPWEMREYLVKTIRGIGYKEASHFLRNIGMGEKLAILDRHIMRNLRKLGVIGEIPRNLTRKKYLEIEEKMHAFCEEIGIPLAHFDLLLWYLETGFVFK